MVPQPKTVIAIIPISKTNGATATGEIIDTKDFDYVNIGIVASTADVVSNTLSVLKIEEGDTTSSFATFAGAVSGTDYTIATNAYTTTTNQNVWSFGVDTRARKRYLRVSASPQTTMVIGGVATCCRAARRTRRLRREAGALNAIYV
jgi:hypothetical protein